MASTKDLKKRITSTKNTQQTTKAMKMVSAAKLRRATDAILSQRPYALEIAKLMAVLAGQGAGAGNPDAGAKKAVSLMVVFSSDRGLCGGYNAVVIRAASQFLTARAAMGKPVLTAFVGKKANELLRIRAKVDAVHFEEFGPKVTFKQASDLAKLILPMYEAGEVDEVVFVYNEFVNAITQEVKVDQILPLNLAHHAKDDSVAHTLHSELAIYSPDKETLYEALSAKYFVVQVFKALLEAQASEHGSRMTAMENATKNAGDMIRKLTLLFNKQRQAAITTELLEIIAGSESQKVQ